MRLLDPAHDGVGMLLHLSRQGFLDDLRTANHRCSSKLGTHCKALEPRSHIGQRGLWVTSGVFASLPLLCGRTDRRLNRSIYAYGFAAAPSGKALPLPLSL